jgi:predicted NBD/HSP70 family sugar kinase
MKPPFLLFDIGGTNMRIAISFDGETIANYRIIPTPKNYDEGIAKFGEIAAELASGNTIGLGVGGIASSLSADKAHIYRAPHLPSWDGKGIKIDLANVLGCQVSIENDTALVGLGEATMGSAKGFALVAYITVSTGVNGVRIVDGKIGRSVYGFEIGHQIIDIDAAANEPQFGRGELEDFIGGEAMQKRHGKSPLAITDPVIWQESARYLAYGIYNSVLYWSPEIVVVGGALMKKIPLDKTKEYLKEYLKIFPEIPRIDAASLGELGGLYGALSYIKG